MRMKKIPIDADFHGQRIRSTVNADIARYYAEVYYQGRREHPEWDAILEGLMARPGIPDADSLRHITCAHSIDLASLFLAERLLSDPVNRPVQAQFERRFRQLQQEALSGKPARLAGLDDVLILCTPGWFYAARPQTGADFALPRKMLNEHGIPNRLIPVDENGTVEANAQTIAASLRAASREYANVILVSGSKGGPEAEMALSLLNESGAAHKVKGWVNVGGLLRGSALADKGLRWPWTWFARFFILKGGSPDSIASLATARSRARHAGLRLPPQIQVLNYVAIPMTGDFSERALRGFVTMHSTGPNDGLTLILDELPEPDPGVTVVELGLDHYFSHPQIHLKTVALAMTIIERVTGRTLQAAPAADRITAGD